MPARPPPDLAPDRPELIELDSGVYRPDTRVLTTQPREVELSPIEGRLAEAEAHARAALALSVGRGARREFESHFELFLVLLDASRAEEAASHLASARVHVGAETTILIVASHAGSGLLAHARGDLTGAREWLARAHTLLTNAEFPPVGAIGRALRLLEARCGEDGGRSNPG